MTQITIELSVDDTLADPDDESGLSEAAFLDLHRALAELGFSVDAIYKNGNPLDEEGKY